MSFIVLKENSCSYSDIQQRGWQVHIMKLIVGQKTIEIVQQI